MSSPTPELRPVIVQAGAGAGKTHGLVEQVLHVFRLFHQSGREPRIILTTFTRKATQELRERMIRRACEFPDDYSLLQFVSDPQKLQISTIHGLLNHFLKSVGQWVDLDAGFSLIAEGEARQLARQCLREVLAAQSDLHWLETFGFDRVLKMCRAFDVGRRESSGLEPADLSDLQAAAEEVVSSSRQELTDLAHRLAGGVEDPKLLKFADELLIFANSWKGGPLEGLPRKPNRNAKSSELNVWHDMIDEVVKPIREEFKHPAWDPSMWPKFADEWQRFHILAESFSQEFQKAKKAKGQFEMADLELLAFETLESRPELGRLFAADVDYWMIDEFQDTSPLQNSILRQLIGETPYYLVGDPQQSIYLFRGAEVGVFFEAKGTVLNAGGEQRELRRNFRSQAGLLAFVNEFVTSVSESFQPMEAVRASSDSHPSCELIRAADEVQEDAFVVARVGELIAHGAEPQDIAILGRTHRELLRVATRLRAYGYPTFVQASRGFSERREVLDASALWLFLLNPHDNANLVALFRSPYFYAPDAEIEEWMKSRPNSLWRKLQGTLDWPEGHAVLRLRQIQSGVAEKGVARAFEEALCASGFLDMCLQQDPAGRKESNFWKMVQKARELEAKGTKSLLHLSDSDRIDPVEDQEGDAASAQEPGCINLMTIHASKGLEFEHVIVVGAGNNPRLANANEFSHHNGRYFFPMWDEELGQNVASVLDRAQVAATRQRELAEFERWLYVAVTRAKASLTLAWSEAAKNSWASRSWFFDLPVGEHERNGFRVRVVDHKEEPSIYQPRAQSVTQVRELWRPHSSVVEQRNSVSDVLADLEKQNSVPRSKDFLLRSSKARAFGQRLHQMFEKAKHHSIQDVSYVEPYLQFVMGLETPPMKKLFAVGHAEWGFQVMTGRGPLEGQIDFWAEDGEDIHLVDYKTGDPDGAKKALQQLSIYAWALRRFGHIQRMHLHAIFPVYERVVSREFTSAEEKSWDLYFAGATPTPRPTGPSRRPERPPDVEA
ncbi:MAG: UvrD-helicase domain-containing protein [Bdellovibrionales bacterium]